MLTFKARDVLQKQGATNIAELSRILKVDIFILREVLDFWVKKGKVKKFLPDSACCTSGKGCNSCNLLSFEFYDWIN